MTWYGEGYGGGETRDALIDGWNTVSTAAAGPFPASGMTVISTPVKNGSGALQIPSGVTGAYGGMTRIPSAGPVRIWCLQGWFNYNGNPTAAHPIFGPLGTLTANWIYLEVGTDRRVRVVQLTDATWANRRPLSDWSVAVLGNGSYTHLVWFIDPLTLGTNNVLMTVLIDNVTQIVQDVGAWPAAMTPGGTAQFTWGILTGGVDIGVNLRIDDACGLYTTSVADAPHLAAAPIGRVYAQHPASDTGAQCDWTRSGATGTWFGKWSDATGNDGDTTCLSGADVNVHQTSAMETLVTLGWDAAATVFESSAGVGPVLSIIHRDLGGTKWHGHTLCTTPAATEWAVVDPGATYIGALFPLARTSGTWARADAGTVFPGLQTGADNHDSTWWATTMMLQWLICNNQYLPLTPGPMIPQGGLF